MPLVSDRCICLRKTEYSETSQIVTLLSRERGVVRAIAKGAHRRTKAGASKFDGGIDFLETGDAVFTDDVTRDLATLTEWSLWDGHLDLRRDLRAMYLAMYAGELVDRLLEPHDPHPVLFDRLEATLCELGTARREAAFLAFELDLLRETGYLADLARCVGCERPADAGVTAYFSPAAGGAVCRDCEAAHPDRLSIDARLLRMAQGILKLPRADGVAQRLPQLTRRQTDPLNRAFAAQIAHTLGRPLAMGRWVLA
jgi:DNA repair protein RecO (recombination protein O)